MAYLHHQQEYKTMSELAKSFSDDFLQGERDCANGVQHVAGKSHAYNRGYATRYEVEQIQSHNSERGIK